MAKIYLSSTFQDLAQHRAKVYRTLRQLHHDVLSMEDYTASPRPPLEQCLADVNRCDVYVGIFAWRAGYRPPGEKRPITELEFRAAVAAGKPCLLFLLNKDAPWPANLIDEDRKPITALREEMQRGYLVQFFTTPDDLAGAVGVAVANQAPGGGGNDPSPGDPGNREFYRDCLRRLTGELGSQCRWYLIVGGVLGVIGVGIALVGIVGLEEEIRFMVSAAGGLVSASTVFPVATMLSTRRKKALLDGYGVALDRDPPAQDALVAIQGFLNRQLQQRVL